MNKEDLLHFRNVTELTLSSLIGFIIDYDEIGNYPNLKKLSLSYLIICTVRKFSHVPEIHLSNIDYAIDDFYTLRDVPILHIKDLLLVDDLNVLSNVGELHITSPYHKHINQNIDNLRTVRGLYLHRLYTDSNLDTFTNIRHIGEVHNIRRSTRLKRRRVSDPHSGVD